MKCFTDYSYLGLFVPCGIRSLDNSYDGLFVPWTIRTTDVSYDGLLSRSSPAPRGRRYRLAPDPGLEGVDL